MTTSAPVPAGGVSNQITGGVFFSAVIQGRDVQVVLPPEIQPALTGLPPASSVFTGREQAVGALRNALAPARPGGVQLVSAVAGMAGIGKTELVLQTARDVLAAGWFPGGVLFVDMFGYDSDRRMTAADALAGWLTAIGIPGEHIPAGEQDRSRLWRSVLNAYTGQGRRLLLIIDNVSSEDQVRPLLFGDGRVPALLTSRHTLDLDARLHDVDVLGPDAALAMIGEVLAARRGPDDPRLLPEARAGLAGLVEVCAGLPLALRIVAALLADRPHLRPQAMVERLRGDRHRLDGLSRQQAAVRAAFDMSYRHLNDAQARLFRLLPVNPGPDIATAAVARLADLGEQQAAGLLADLERAHLITEPAAERWSMHDLLRLYATGQQSADGEQLEVDQARERLYGYYRDTAREANTHLSATTPSETSTFGDRSAALAWLDAEHTNLIATVTAAPDHVAVTAAVLAAVLIPFLDFRRHFTDWLTIMTRVGDFCRARGDKYGEAFASDSRGLALRQLRRFDEAIAAHTEARVTFRAKGDRHAEGVAWDGLGLALRKLRRFDEAIEAHTRARLIFRAIRDPHGEGIAWHNLGSALAEARRFDRAIAAYAEAGVIFRTTGDRYAEGGAWGGLGSALTDVRRFDEAVAAHTKARDIFRAAGDSHGEGTACNNLGTALRRLRRFDEAVEALTKARDIYRATADQHGEGLAWNNLGLALADTGRYDEAVEAHTKARDIYRAIGDRHGEGMAWNNLGQALADSRRYDEAVTAHTKARDIYRATGDRYGEGSAWNNLGLALTGLRRFEEAVEAHAEGGVIFQEIGDRYAEGATWNNLGTALRHLGRIDEAVAAHTRARDVFRAIEDRHGEGSAWHNLGLALVEMRRIDEARAGWEQALAAYTGTDDSHRADTVRKLLDRHPPSTIPDDVR
ncbi:tetratricopeptide repeat protein [Paractinoplanes globisporus]|uniref:Tetratricopeptide repeat protein n=1 Tax=Paractinoplanes globisporus TaxID=113565 RepID=A0ABW6WCX2_9ACTN|nr:tetratricopeptide repeat protein [Actinoplanes globisporus]